MNGGQLFLVAVCCMGLVLGSEADRRQLLAPAFARAGSRSSSKEGTSASAITRAISNGGIARSYAAADSKAQEKMSGDVIHAVSQAVAYVKAGGDAKAAALGAGKTIGEAVAKAYATTIAKVYVEGDGKACGNAGANARASAVAYAAIVAKAIVYATDGASKADANAYAKAIEIATVTAFAEASSYACTTGGWGFAQQTSWAESVRHVYADVVAAALAYIHGGDAKGYSKSKADSYNREITAPISRTYGTSKGVSKDGGVTKAVADGKASASGFRVDVCKGNAEWCCFDTSSSTCSCGDGCEYTKIDTKEGITAWYPRDDSKNQPCYCAGGYFG